MSRKTYYTLSFTWGLPLTLIGAIVALFLLATKHRPHLWRGCLCFEIGKTRWGGLNLGLVILCQHNASDSLKSHELGHAVQNCYLGPIMLLFVFCSAVRYHYRDYKERKGEKLPPYDSWWFEGQATEYGHKYIKLE